MTEKPHIKLDVPFGEDKVLLHTCCAPCSGAIIECLLDNGVRPTIFYCNPNIWPEEEYLIRRNECTRFAAQLGLDIIDDDYDHKAWLNGIEGLYKGLEGLSVENVGEAVPANLSPDRCGASCREVICGGNPDVWKRLSAEPERGERCLLCFKYRLLRTALYAVGHGFRVMTTTLASSRWKSLPQINEAGNWAVAQVLAAAQTVDVSAVDACAVGGSGVGSGAGDVNAIEGGAVGIDGIEIANAGAGDANAVEYSTGEAGVPHSASDDGRQDSGESLVWWEQNWRKGGLQERRGQLIRENGFYNQKWCGCEFSKTSIFDTVE